MRVRRIVVTVVLLGAIGALSGCSDGPEIVGEITPITPSATASPAELVLADTGIGGLHLGQSKEQALATGLIGKLAGPTADDSEGCAAYHGRQGIEQVYFHAGKVMIISVTRSILTDKGIGLGDTYESLHDKYPDAILDRESGLDRIYPAAPKAQMKAVYRIVLSSDNGYPDDKILELALQANTQPCYE